MPGTLVAGRGFHVPREDVPRLDESVDIERDTTIEPGGVPDLVLDLLARARTNGPLPSIAPDESRHSIRTWSVIRGDSFGSLHQIVGHCFGEPSPRTSIRTCFALVERTWRLGQPNHRPQRPLRFPRLRARWRHNARPIPRSARDPARQADGKAPQGHYDGARRNRRFSLEPAPKQQAADQPLREIEEP
jgi:hypothetical protein